MAYFQKFIGHGVIGHVDMKYTPSGTAKLHFSIGVDRSYKKDSKTDWIQCICLGKTGELHSEFMKVGREVIVEGRVETYKHENGFMSNVNVTNLEYIDKKAKSSLGDCNPDDGIPQDNEEG